ELTADLVDEEGDLVADPARAVAAEVGEVFADLRGVHPGQLGQTVAADALDLFLSLFDEDPQVHRQSGNRGLGDAATSAFSGHAPPTLGTGAHVHKAGSAIRAVRTSCIRSRRQRR